MSALHRYKEEYSDTLQNYLWQNMSWHLSSCPGTCHVLVPFMSWYLSCPGTCHHVLVPVIMSWYLSCPGTCHVPCLSAYPGTCHVLVLVIVSCYLSCPGTSHVLVPVIMSWYLSCSGTCQRVLVPFMFLYGSIGPGRGKM